MACEVVLLVLLVAFILLFGYLGSNSDLESRAGPFGVGQCVSLSGGGWG